MVKGLLVALAIMVSLISGMVSIVYVFKRFTWRHNNSCENDFVARRWKVENVNGERGKND